MMENLTRNFNKLAIKLYSKEQILDLAKEYEERSVEDKIWLNNHNKDHHSYKSIKIRRKANLLLCMKYTKIAREIK